MASKLTVAIVILGWVATILAWPSAVFAQQNVSGANVTVQLPSFSAVGVNTSVLVPDGGVSPVARERQAFYSRFSPLALPPSRATGIERRDAMIAATAVIHDPQEADAELLRQARSRRANLSRSALAEQIARPTPAADQPPRSVADIQRTRAAKSEAANTEVQELLVKARRAALAGKQGVAGVYFDQAARRAAGETKRQIEAEKRQVAAEARQLKPSAVARRP